jgi:hypothetical protein
MSPTPTMLHILNEESSPSRDRVMRAYWLAPRAPRSATVLALHDASSGAPVRSTHADSRRRSDDRRANEPETASFP